MCQNKEVSLLITIFATSVIIKLCIDYKNTNEIKYLYMAVYVCLLSFIQFIEFFIHAFPKKSYIYQIASLCTVFGIVAQFIFSEICIHTYGNVHKAFCVFDILYLLGFIYFIPTLIKNFGKYDNNFVCSNWFGCKLKWDAWDKTNDKNTYIRIVMDIIYVSYFCYASYLVFGIPGLVLYLISFSIIYLPVLIYLPFKNYGTDGTGSAWCILAVVIIITYIIVPKEYLDSKIIDS